MSWRGAAGATLAAAAGALGVVGALAAPAAHAQVPPVTTPPINVDVPGLGISVHVPGQEVGAAPGAPGSPAPARPTPAPATDAPPPPPPPPAAPAAPATAAPEASGSPQAAGGPAARTDRGGGDRTVGSTVARAVTEPFTLVSALTLALGLGVVVGAAPYLPRYRRRQRELLEQWARASEHERAVAANLAETDHQKSEFLALVSHELRTPLTAVKGFVDTVLLHWDRLPDERRRELLGRASTNADALSRLVGQLMEYARSDIGPIEIAPAQLDVLVAVDGALHALAPVVAEHRVEVDVSGGLVVEADADAFNHVLANLLTNAMKFSPPRSRVLVRARPTGDEVVVSVTNEGAGIPAHEQELIFDRFYQSSDGDRGRGTGIGLTIAQRFTALHGGRIWVESEPGCGATFSFTMPAATRALAPAQ